MKIIDLHCDTICRLEEALADKNAEDGSYTLAKNPFHVDLQKLEAGGYLLQTFALFVDQGAHPDSFAWCKRLLARCKKELEANRQRIGLVTSYQMLAENERAGRLSALLSVEEGDVCGTDLSRVGFLYEQGVRMMTLTWNYPNAIAYPNRMPHYTPGAKGFEAEQTRGLTAFGREVVREMNRLSMIIDVSHMGDAGIRDVLSLSSQPIIASHSNARAVCPFVRNLPDELIRGIADKGGVIGLNFCPAFLEEKHGEQCVSSVEAMLLHLRHLRKIGGIDCIALGSDFDGIGGELEIKDASMMQRLARAMERDGFTQTEIGKICYQNAKRYLKEMLK